MDNYWHTRINLVYWVALIFPLSPIVGTGDLTITFFVWSLGMVWLGSIFPDIDHGDARIHRLPIVGTFVQYFIWKPLARVLKPTWLKHRGFVHSISGLIMITTLLFIYLGGVSRLLWWGVIEIVTPLSIQVLMFDLFAFVEAVEMRPFDEAYFGTFILLSAIAFTFGFFFHLWLDYSTVMSIRWIRFWKKPLKDGYVRTDSRNERRAIHLFSIFPVGLILVEFLGMHSLREWYGVFILLAVGALFLIGLTLHSPRVLIRLLLAFPCPACYETDKGVQILRLKKGKEKYGCSNFFTTGCDYQAELEPEAFDHLEVAVSTVDRILEVLFMILMICGFVLHPVFLILGVGLFGVQIIQIFRQKQLFILWRQKQ